jgi:PIN domain nuclease of toxin-antitoxin system
VARIVLDASAVLALVLREKGADVVAGLKAGSLISAVNLAEVGTLLIRDGLGDEAMRQVVRALELDVAPFDERSALAAAELRRLTGDLGLSLGDRACLALAKSIGGAAVTADRSWAQLTLDIEIRLIR